ncbi:MAG: DUF3365 domain-containing protein [Woeseiaceae bacterium]|nr:DUF3365 domain-containing protein [Woeseiaceae bacterium]
MKNLLILALLAGVLAGCSQGSPPAAVEAERPPERGAEILVPFKQDLKAALVAGLAEGPAAAISACNVEAPGIAAELSVNGVRVGRSSHKLRNPANGGPDWVTPLLDAYLADTSNRSPVTVTLDDGRSGYVEPIIAQPMCLTCHGEVLAPDIAERIAALYPEDQATGFAEGDLRGVFWVEYE